jgi:hypothetical protein
MDINYATLTDCSLQQIGLEFAHKEYSIAVQRGSKLRNEISAV